MPIAQPQWTRDSTILKFCQSHLLYFRFLAKTNVFFTSLDWTNIFLCAVAPSKYADVVTTIQTSLDTYCHPDDNGHRPDQFCLNKTAMLIHNNAKHQVWDIHTPWIHCVSVPDSVWDDGYKSDKLPLCLVQGYCPQVNCIEHQGNCSPAGHGASPRFGDCYGDCKDCPPAGPPQSRYNRPDQCC